MGQSRGLRRGWLSLFSAGCFALALGACAQPKPPPDTGGLKKRADEEDRDLQERSSLEAMLREPGPGQQL